MARKIRMIRARMDEIAAEMNKFHLKTGQPQDRQMVIQKLIQGRETSSTVDKMSIIGRDDDKQSIMRMVMDTETKENVSIISIVGIGGLGKTTLAQLVYSDERVREKRHFDLLIWVYVSMDFDPVRVGKAMMEDITGSKCELETLNTISKQLEGELKGKRFLVVLDDVWNEDGPEGKWEKLKPIFTAGTKGSKILVTTRDEEVASIMKAAPYRLKVLSEEDCWALFKRRAFEGGNEEQEDQSIVAIGQEIVRKCGGVPLAAKALGSIMRSKKGREAWSAARDSEMWLPKGTDGVLSSLRLSYACLPSPLKQCFTYCSIFPKGYEIDKDDLIAQWIAQGFISSMVGGRQMEDIGNEYFNDLLWLSFFQDLQETYHGRVICKMHDLVRDLAQHVAGNEILVLEQRKAMTGIDKRCRWLALTDCDLSLAFPTSLKKMRGLKLCGTSSNDVEGRCNFMFRPGMFSNAQCLRALDLKDVHSTESLPASASNLRNLRYLRASCEKPLPEYFYNLQNLQTLHLSDCHGLEKIPEFVSRLQNLRSLILVNCNYLVTLPESIGDLHELRTLKVESSFRMQAIPESIGKLYSLQRISLSCCWHLVELPDSIGSLLNLQELHLFACLNLRRLPESISNLVRLEKLNLGRCIGLEELPQGLGNMANLRYLTTRDCDLSCGMPLGVGRLTNLQALDRFVVGDGRDQRYAKVSELEHLNKISGDLVIKGLKSVRDPEDARRAKLKEMQNLSSLSLDWNMPADGLFAPVEEEGDEEAVLESLQPHPNIKKLDIRNYPGVSFPKWIESSPFPTLEYIKLVGMRNCKHLPPLGLLPSLRDLCIEGMDAVKRVGAEFYGIGRHSGNMTVLFPSLELLKFEDMSNLEEWCTVVESDGSSSSKSSSGHPSPPLFPCLSTLKIKGCPKLRLLNISRCDEMSSLPEGIPFPEWLGDVTSDSVGMYGCPRLSCLPEGLQCLTALQSLEIINCPQLTGRCERDRTPRPIIAHIPNTEITDQ